MNKFRASWIDLLIISAIFLIVASFIWAQEIRQFEDSLPPIKYLFYIPCIFYIYYLHYKSDAKKFAGTGRRVIGRGVLIFAGVLLTLIILYIYLLSKGLVY